MFFYFALQMSNRNRICFLSRAMGLFSLTAIPRFARASEGRGSPRASLALRHVPLLEVGNAPSSYRSFGSYLCLVFFSLLTSNRDFFDCALVYPLATALWQTALKALNEVLLVDFYAQ
jgi:hypothetical protein